MPQYEELSKILAGLRFTESGGSYAGNYAKRAFYNGEEYVGAYGIPRSQWGPWSTFAGLRDAPILAPAAQDRVAASVLQAYYQRYGSWDMALAAWYMGPAEANKLLDAGGIPALETLSKVASQYISTATSAAKVVPIQYLKQIAPDAFAQLTASVSSWIMPVAGQSQWSRGSFMDKHTKHSGSHHAIDIYAKEGTPIVAPVAGTILNSGTGGRGGNWVQIKGNDGVVYYFAHMAAPTVAEKGSVVRPGFHIGYVGNTGSARGTSPHLHLTMKVNGRPINPSQFLEGSAALEWNERGTAQPVFAEQDLEQPYTQQGAMMTRWIQGLSDTVAAGGKRKLPPREPISTTDLRQKMAAAEQRDREPSELDDKEAQRQARMQ